MKINNLLDKITGNRATEARKFHKRTQLKKLVAQEDPKNWPIEWKHIHFKSYPRLKQIILKTPAQEENNNLFQVIKNRRSGRDFHRYKITKNQLSKLLLFSAGITKNTGNKWDETTRTYPSAGARYPLEVYPLILNSNDLEKGFYHYDVKKHQLELLLDGDFAKKITLITGQDWVESSSVIFIITAVLGRSQIKYGERAYRYCLFEAGHVAQNIYLVAAEMNLQCCAIGGFIDKEINLLLDLNDENEIAIYLVAVGT